MKRFLSFALCLLLVLTQFLALPIGTIAATTHYTVWADADALDHDRLWTMQGGVGGIGRTTKHVQGGKAYAWNRGTTGAASTAVFSAPNRLAGSKNALVFWVDTVDQIAATAAYAIKVYTTTSTGNTTCFRIAAGGTASLISGGSVTPLVCATDSVTLLKDVSGWVVIPFTSFENQWGPETTTATGAVFPDGHQLRQRGVSGRYRFCRGCERLCFRRLQRHADRRPPDSLPDIRSRLEAHRLR